MNATWEVVCNHTLIVYNNNKIIIIIVVIIGHDVAQKAASIVGGIALLAGGVALGILTGIDYNNHYIYSVLIIQQRGIVAIVIGGIAAGAGARYSYLISSYFLYLSYYSYRTFSPNSSGVHGVIKTVKKEKIEASGYFIDVGIGAATSVLSGLLQNIVMFDYTIIHFYLFLLPSHS